MKKGITILILVVIIVVIIYVAYTFLIAGETSDGIVNTADEFQALNDLTEADLLPLQDSTYEDMMTLIMTPKSSFLVEDSIFNDYPGEPGFYELLEPDFYSGDRYEFDNVVEKRMNGLIPVQEKYKIQGVIYTPGALIDVYEAVGGSFFMDEMTDKWLAFKAGVNEIYPIPVKGESGKPKIV